MNPLVPVLPTGHEATPPVSSALPVAIYPSWQVVHAHLTAQANASPAPTSLGTLALYYYCAYHAFGSPADGAFARQLAQRLATQPWPAPGSRWAAPQVDQAVVLAWLSAQGEAASGAMSASRQLVALDEALYKEARFLLAQPPCPRPVPLRIARYLRLRLPAPSAQRYLLDLLAHWPSVVGTAAPYPLVVGLADGLAAELLGLIRTHQAGVLHPTIRGRVEQGLRQLLATKRAVDCLAHAYAIFPGELQAGASAGSFSAELSWQRGDVGLAWLLYEAQAWLPDAELANLAELVGLHTLLRTSIATTEVTGPGFQRGAAGVAHLYGQLFRLSRQPAYRTAYHFWLGRTQALLNLGPASAAAEAEVTTELLGGLAGVGLVLLTALQEASPNWEAVLV